MADAAAARREARRRRILENSHNRFQIISGKSSDECPRESPLRAVIPEPEYDFSAATSSSIYSHTSQHNGVLLSPPSQLTELLLSHHGIDAAGDGEPLNDLASLLPPIGSVPSRQVPAEIPRLTVWEKIATNKYDIVLLSLLIQVLYYYSLVSFDNGYFFLPVCVYTVTKQICYPTQNNSGIANMLMLLNGISPARVQKILYITQIFGVITRDISIYLFTTVCTQMLFTTLRDSLVT